MEAKANRIIAEELKDRGLQMEELEAMRKMHPIKAQIGRRLRKETTMTLAWIGRRLHAGSPSTLAGSIYQLKS